MSPKEGDKVCLECGGVNGHDAGCCAGDDQVFEVISAYSRTQAIEDGVLVDCSQPPFDQLNREAGIKVHVAMTAEAFDLYVHPIEVSAFPVQTIQNGNGSELPRRSGQLPAGQTMTGRYWDIIWMLRLAMQSHKHASCVSVRLHVVPNRGGPAEPAELKCVAGPDDDGNLCLTIMLPDQD